MIDWNDFLKQGGHGGFRGYRYQRGGFALGSLFSGLFKSLVPTLKTVGKSVAKQALRTGLDVAQDVVGGENVVQSLEKRGRAGASKLLGKAAKKPRKRRHKGRGGLGSYKRKKRGDLLGL